MAKNGEKMLPSKARKGPYNFDFSVSRKTKWYRNRKEELDSQQTFRQKELHDMTLLHTTSIECSTNNESVDFEMMSENVEDQSLNDEITDGNKEPYHTHADTDYVSDEEAVNDEKSSVPSQMLYNGSRLTLAASMLLTISFVMRHSLSGTAFQSLLVLLELFCPTENNFSKTLSMFKNYFTDTKDPIQKNYYCNSCNQFFGNTDLDCCDNCSSKDTSYFLSLPLVNQLSSILKGKNMNHRKERKKKDNNNIEDVYDGQLYKEHFDESGYWHGTNKEKKLEEVHISLQVNTDGVSIFKSSSFSVWPLYAVINELSPQSQFSRENRIFMGLWFGKKKPAMNMFLKPFMEEVQNIFKTGIQVMTAQGLKTIRAIILSVVADAPARCLMLNMMQFNGNYGCPCCLIPGESHQIGENGHSRIYRYNLNNPKLFGHHELRTHDSTIKIAKQVIDNFRLSRKSAAEPIMGVKGFSSMVKAPGLDIIRGTTIDYMHCVLLGVMKMMLSLWFDISHRTKDWSIRNKIKEINERLLSIQPPNFINRMPQNLEDISQWKASELRSFLIFYSIAVLNGYLPSQFFEHFILLPQAIFLLLQDTISSHDLNKSRKMLQKFCLQMEELYEDRYLTFNLHCLLHLVDKVKDLGPLWSHSCFFYEDLNGDLRSLFHGTNNIQQQILLAANIQQQIPTLKKDLTCQPEAEDLFNSFYEKRSVAKKEQIGHNIFLVGKIENAKLSTEKFNILQNLVGKVISCSIFYRVLQHNYIINCVDYTVVKKRNSYTILYNGDKYGFVKCFLKVVKENGDISYVALVNKLEHVVVNSPIDSVVHMKLVKRSSLYEAVLVKDILALCVYIHLANDNYAFICRSPNCIEKD